MINVFELCLNFIDAIIIFGFLLKYNKFKWKDNLLYLFSCFIYFVSTYFVDRCVSDPLLQIMLYAGLLFVATGVLKERPKITKRIFSIIIILIVYTCVNPIITLLGAIMLNTTSYNIISPDGEYRIFSGIIAKLAVLAVSNFIIKFSNSENNLNKTENILIFLMYSISILMSYFVYTIGKQYDLYEFAFILIFCIIIINVITFIIYTIINKVNKTNLQYSLEMQSIKYSEQFSVQIEESAKSLREIKHDLTGHFNTLLNMLENTQTDKAVDYIKQYVKQLDKFNSYVQTKDSVLNFAVNSLLTKAQSMGIEIETIIDNNVLFELNSLEITSVVNNILNNAIEAILTQDKPRIVLKIYFYKGYSVLKVKNTIHKSVLENNPDLDTTKTDFKNHGFGIKRIKDIANRNGGFVNIKEEHGYFDVGFYIPNN